MSNIIGAITEGNRTNLDSRTNVDLQGEPFKTFKFKTDSFRPQHQATIISQKNIAGDTLIWGNDAFGIWGLYNWGDIENQSFILGLGLLGLNSLGLRSSAFEIVRVVPPRDTFEESFVSDYFINTSETNATITTGNVNFSATSELLVSDTIYLNQTNVTKANMTIVSTSEVSNFGMYLSNDSGATWESVSQGISHNFSDSTGNDVKYKLVPLTPGKNVTKVTVKINQ